MIYRLFCWLGKCLRCSPKAINGGMGGACIDCGKVHGWVSGDQLRRYADAEWAREDAEHRSEFERLSKEVANETWRGR